MRSDRLSLLGQRAFWRQATVLAQKHGINKTAGALGLKYESLKKHLEAACSETSDPKQARAAFVEL